MWYAKLDDDEKVEPFPGARAHCPTCGSLVMAKCGAIVTHHWAHIAREDCDQWAEPDSAWHRGWQECVDPSRREVRIGWHRADIQTKSGYVVELQHSSISTEDIRSRETFYGPRMVWIFDAVEAYEEGRLSFYRREGYFSFRWRHPRKSIAFCTRRVYLDLGDGCLFAVKKMHPEAPCRGWGQLGKADPLHAWMNRGDALVSEAS